MKTLIICELSEVFIVPQIITEKNHKLKFTKGTTKVDLNEENIKKLKDFVKPYRDYIKIEIGDDVEKLNPEIVVADMNKRTELENKKAALLSELEDIKNNPKDIEKKEIIEKFKSFVNDDKAKKEDIIKQIEENIEKLEA